MKTYQLWTIGLLVACSTGAQAQTKGKDHSSSPKKSEVLYTCASGFGFPDMTAYFEDARHDLVLIPDSGKIFAINSVGSREFSGKNHSDALLIRAADENTQKAVWIDDQDKISIDYNMMLVHPVAVTTQPTKMTTLSTTDAELKLQALVAAKALKDIGKLQDDEAFSEQESDRLEMRISKIFENEDSNRASDKVEKLYKNFMASIDHKEAKLQSCNNLKNGTLKQAAESETRFLEERRAEIASVFQTNTNLDYGDYAKTPASSTEALR